MTLLKLKIKRIGRGYFVQLPKDIADKTINNGSTHQWVYIIDDDIAPTDKDVLGFIFKESKVMRKKK